MDIENLDAGQPFDALPDTYTIFITENDVLGKDLPFYRIERYNLDLGELFHDGSHILYINGAYRNDDDIGRLMHDFSCTKSDDMYYEPMKDITHYYKETEEGVKTMCKAFEETREEGREEGRKEGREEGREEGRKAKEKEIYLRMLNMNFSPEQAHQLVYGS